MQPPVGQLPALCIPASESSSPCWYALRCVLIPVTMIGALTLALTLALGLGLALALALAQLLRTSSRARCHLQRRKRRVRYHAGVHWGGDGAEATVAEAMGAEAMVVGAARLRLLPQAQAPALL